MLRAVLTAILLLPVLATAAGAAEPSPFVIPDWQSACAVHGPGFKALPGSSSCIRIGGRATMAVDAGTRRSAPAAGRRAIGMGAMGQVEADVRTQTEVGPLRAFVRLRAGSGTGTAPLSR
ncbi:porin [Chelatococcus reniformis]|uniref:Porin n=1 Tax=Chelatococcus reniformis TaxID=1494448 RepID=A0A916U9B1_9HYPH|nr:porin [Chelatococcus reniformis]GGC62761.1 hypothetical protein GCM10010994_21720 [Chelatococcus reniformis]